MLFIKTRSIFFTFVIAITNAYFAALSNNIISSFNQYLAINLASSLFCMYIHKKDNTSPLLCRKASYPKKPKKEETEHGPNDECHEEKDDEPEHNDPDEENNIDLEPEEDNDDDENEEEDDDNDTGSKKQKKVKNKKALLLSLCKTKKEQELVKNLNNEQAQYLLNKLLR